METAPYAGLYVHIPFCERLCLYCDFYSKVGSKQEIDRFIDALTHEARRFNPACKEMIFDTVFLGGGTPSILAPRQIERLFAMLRDRLNIADSAEITIECNPSALNPPKLDTYKAVGINRLSLGVQSFDDRHLRRLGRLHNSAQAISAFDLARNHGLDDISIDLIYGLPDQTLDEWIADLDSGVELNPEHISAYNLIIEDDTPFGELYSRGELSLPPDDIQSGMYEALNERLAAAGYTRYEISNFARPGFECRHNLKYWRLETYIGLGPAAVSFDGSMRWKNLPDLDAYLAALEDGQPPPREMEEMTPAKFRTEFIMLSLRMTEGLSLDELRARFGCDLRTEKGDVLAALEAGGLVAVDGDRIRLAARGLFVSDEVIVRLI